MKKYFCMLIIVFTACNANKSLNTNTSETKTFLSLIKKLNRDTSNSDLKSQISILYTKIAQVYLDRIKSYSIAKDINKWDEIIKEYEALKNLYDIIPNSSAITQTLKIPSYKIELQRARQDAAEEYYNSGLANINSSNKQFIRRAYIAFKKSNDLIPGYKDITNQMEIAYEKSKIKVIINPVEDNSEDYNTSINHRINFSYSYFDFDKDLVRDLGATYKNNSYAIFYTEMDTRKKNIYADWKVDLTWTDLYVPQPIVSYSSRKVSTLVEAGRDSSGKAIYQTVYATINLETRSYTASGDMELKIIDLNSKENITIEHYKNQIRWQENYQDYDGDSRAGNNYVSSPYANNTLPIKEDVLYKLSQRIYPQIKNKIISVVNL